MLVQAGAGGVGHMSVQIARLAGARVATTVTPGPKAELASSLGAELCIDYRREDVGEKLRAWTGTDGADVVHDTVGHETFTACFSLVRPYGDLVSNVESPWEDEAITAMHDRNLRVSFTWMPAPSVFGWPEHRERQRRILERAAADFDSGDLRIVRRRDVPARTSCGRPPRARGRPGHGKSGSHIPITELIPQRPTLPRYIVRPPLCCWPQPAEPAMSAPGGYDRILRVPATCASTVSEAGVRSRHERRPRGSCCGGGRWLSDI